MRPANPDACPALIDGYDRSLSGLDLESCPLIAPCGNRNYKFFS